MTSIFGSTHFRPSAFGSRGGGSGVARYSRTDELEPVDGGGFRLQKLETISAMPVYKGKSTEELRWEDYNSGDKGGTDFDAWVSNLCTGSELSAKSASNPFSSSTHANIFASKTRASASKAFGESSSQPVFGANTNSSGFFCRVPTTSISSHFGSEPLNSVSPSLFKPATAQVPVSQSVAPSFGLSRESTFSSAPGGCCCKCPSHTSNTAFTGNGSASAGRFSTSTQFNFPPNLSGFAQATTSTPSPFRPLHTVPCTDVPISDFAQSVDGTGVPVGNFGQSVPGGPTPRMGSVQTAPSPSSFSSTPSNLFASQKPTFTGQKFGVPTTPIFGSSSYAAPSGECPFGKSFVTPFSSSSANLFACQTPALNSADLVSSATFGPCLFGQPSANPFSSSTSTNSFAAFQTPSSASAFEAPTTTPFASSVFAAPSSPSPTVLSANPFSSTPSNMFAPKTSPFGSSGFGESTAFAFTTTPSSSLGGFGTASGFGSEANGFAPSSTVSSSPTFGSPPSVCSSSFSFGTSSQGMIKAHSTPVAGSYTYSPFGAPNSSVLSPFGSVASNSVSPSSSGPCTIQSFKETLDALHLPSCASTGNGSKGCACLQHIYL